MGQPLTNSVTSIPIIQRAFGEVDLIMEKGKPTPMFPVWICKAVSAKNLFAEH